MKYLALVLIAAATMSFTKWDTSFAEAKQKATTQHKYILLNFSGSDWCGPCIRLHKEFLETEAFSAFADSTLELVNADFPRQKKNRLEKDQVKQNEQLAELYNPNGVFPFTLLLDENGKVIKSWEGLPKIKPDEFTNEIKVAISNGK